MRKYVEYGRAVVIGNSADITDTDHFIPENGVDQRLNITADAEALDQIVAGSGLYESDFRAFKIPNAVYDCIHCAVTAENNERAFFSG